MRPSTTLPDWVPTPVRPMRGDEKRIILASSLGTVFEWYDFYLYGSLAAIIGARFFGGFDPVTRDVFALLAFAAGFLVRPVGALVFGRLGDLAGRRRTFLITILVMGISTVLVGVLPTSGQVGALAPLLLVALRVLQGLAIGGEYGGAAIYVAEHAPAGRRGAYTSWIQTTATLGLLLSLVVILIVQSSMSAADFAAWGWRIPFLGSCVLLAISVWIRVRLTESPAFQRMKDEGKRSRAPVAEAFFEWDNARWAILALLGLVAGQTVVWYTGQFYALFFLRNVMKMDGFSANVLVAWSLAIGALGYLLFGWLSDRVGRKPLILGGCVLAAMTYFPVFGLMARTANPDLTRAQADVPVVLSADPATCSFLFNPTGLTRYSSPCDTAKLALAGASVSYRQVRETAGAKASLRVGPATLDPASPSFQHDLSAALTAAGYPVAANASVLRLSGVLDVFRPRPLTLLGCLLFLVLLSTMIYGPMAACLVELFPTRIRYTAMSLPYHVGNGWIGGLLPAAVFAMNAQSGSILFGLWYPIVFAAGSAVVGCLFLPETRSRDIFAGDLTYHPGDIILDFDPNAADY